MNEEQKRAKICGLIFSFVYIACFFLSFYLFVFVPELLGNPNMTTGIGLWLIFLSLLTPLSIVISVGLIWNRYLSNKFRAMYICCLIPPITALIVIIALKFIESLLL